MTREQLDETLAALRKTKRWVGGSRERALALLVRYGLVTPDGELHANYGGATIPAKEAA